MDNFSGWKVLVAIIVTIVILAIVFYALTFSIVDVIIEAIKQLAHMVGEVVKMAWKWLMDTLGISTAKERNIYCPHSR